MPRICDLNYLVASCRGKIEMTLAEEEGAEDKLIKSLTGEAVKAVFDRYADAEDYETITEQFKGNLTFPAGDDLAADEFVANMKAIKGLPQAAADAREGNEARRRRPRDAGERRRVPARRAVRQQPAEQVQREGQDVLQEVIPKPRSGDRM